MKTTGIRYTQRKEKIIATLGGEEYCFDERDFATISCLETQEEEEVVSDQELEVEVVQSLET